MLKIRHNTLSEWMYKKDISKTKTLSAIEQLELLEKAQNGDNYSKNKLIVCNLRFILKQTLRYSSCNHIKQSDLINEGVLGLIRAIETFDSSKVNVFITYAIWWIKVYIRRYIIEKDNSIKLPETVIMRIKKQLKKYSNDNDLPFDVYEYIHMKQLGLSYDLLVYKNEDNSLTLADILEDHKTISPEHSVKDIHTKKKLIVDFLDILPEIERFIITHSYGIGCRKYSMEKISKKLNIVMKSLILLKQQAINRIRFSDNFKLQEELYQDFIETDI